MQIMYNDNQLIVFSFVQYKMSKLTWLKYPGQIILHPIFMTMSTAQAPMWMKSIKQKIKKMFQLQFLSQKDLQQQSMDFYENMDEAVLLPHWHVLQPPKESWCVPVDHN